MNFNGFNDKVICREIQVKRTSEVNEEISLPFTDKADFPVTERKERKGELLETEGFLCWKTMFSDFTPH